MVGAGPMTKRTKPTHPHFLARMQSEAIGMRGAGPSTPESEALYAASVAEAEALWEREYGKEAMPALLEAYARDLAAWEVEQGDTEQGDTEQEK